ncbi:unnamed protein product [Trichogramma brassicae]|uniref:CCHC-type domain-containing protein n=1 Tax=Trichogramma brassicae TaxID=86971 RepID=A0A6H5HVV1_9HYME|nr:unnamed protein product [Trichogramma brassicae]
MKLENKKWVPTRSIVLTIEGQHLPDHVYIWGVRTKVEPYVQNVMQCYNCLKFGHITKTCRGKTVCFNCGDLQHPEKACQSTTPTCANCKTDTTIDPLQIHHVSISSRCPKIQEQKRINTLMAYENLSFAEAKALIIPRKNHNAAIKTKENFPTLANGKSQILKKYNQQEKMVIHKPPYSSIHSQAESYKEVADKNMLHYSDTSDKINLNGLSQESLSTTNKNSSLLLTQENKNDKISLMNTTNKLSSRLNKNDSSSESGLNQ